MEGSRQYISAEISAGTWATWYILKCNPVKKGSEQWNFADDAVRQASKAVSCQKNCARILWDWKTG